MGGTIVCGVSVRDADFGATELASALSARLGMRLVLVHVLDGTTADAESALDLLGADVGAETRLVDGDRVLGLAQAAEEEGADLIVVGSRSAGSRGRKLHCDLACGLEASTRVPVAIAPPSTRRRASRRLAAAGAP